MIQIADWKDAADYPAPDKASNESLAWEFLRRNEDYQSAWAEYERKVRALAGGDALTLSVLEYVFGACCRRCKTDPLRRSESDPPGRS